MSVTTTIEHVVDIDADPATVFRLWTTAEGLCAWWGVSAVVDARPGGSIRVDIDGEHVMAGEFVELAPPHRVRFSFGWDGGDPPAGSTQVEVRIDAKGAGTRLTLRLSNRAFRPRRSAARISRSAVRLPSRSGNPIRAAPAENALP